MASAQKVVLVHPPPFGEVPFRHIGLAYLRAVLERAGLRTTMRDLSAQEAVAGTDFYGESILHLSRSVGDVSDGLDPGILMEVLHPERFPSLRALSRAVIERVDARFEEVAAEGDVFLFTSNILTYYYGARLAHRLRALGKKTATGGPSTHFAPIRDLLLRSGAFDAVVEGEGEDVVASLVRGLRGGGLAGIPGVAHLGADQRVRSGGPAPLPDLGTLPDPWFDADDVRDFVPILASRGCAARCTYCSEPFNWERHRRRDPAEVVAEMDRAQARWGSVSFHFHDDMINGSLPWFDAFLDLLVARRGRYRWESFCGPRGLDEARLERMAASGCVLLKMGVQSFAPGTLRLMRRGEDVEQLERAIVLAERAGISMHYDMLTSFPGETEEDHGYNLRTIDAIFQRTRGVFFSLNPFYLAIGSDTHLHPERHGLTLRHFDPATLPPPLAEIVRASGEHPVGFSSALSTDVVRRRVAQLGAILQRYDRDYLYLGQDEVPDGSDAFQAQPSRSLGGEDVVEPLYRALLAPWSPGQVRGGWALRALARPSGGEDGLVRYVFSRHVPPHETGGGGEVSVRLAPRSDERPCFVRTGRYNVFYDSGSDDDQGEVEPERVAALVRTVVALVRRNEERAAGLAVPGEGR